jgi:hypothetical protein
MHPEDLTMHPEELRTYAEEFRTHAEEFGMRGWEGVGALRRWGVRAFGFLGVEALSVGRWALRRSDVEALGRWVLGVEAWSVGPPLPL